MNEIKTFFILVVLTTKGQCCMNTKLSKKQIGQRMVKLRKAKGFSQEKCAGKPNVGETVLYKLLYFFGF